MPSPTLFKIFISELEKLLKKSKYRGITMGNAIEVHLLMYADDIVLAGDTVLEFQRKINILEIFCETWGMEVNLKKTKVVAFRNGGKTSKSERFFYRNRSFEIVTYYRYLGLIFFSRNVWSKALSTLISQAEKSLSIVSRIIWKVGHLKLHVSFRIFDSRIVPILCYSSKIWGHTYQDQIEKTYVNFCKFVLGVSKTASNSVVLGECGRLPHDA